VTSYTYDGLGRPLNTTVTEGGAVTGQTTVAYTLTGQKQLISNSGHTTSYIYDALGRLTQESETGSVIKTYAYDIGGNRTSFQLKTNGTTRLSETYEYDNLTTTADLESLLPWSDSLPERCHV
jgi:YD repeat-containing protein